MECCICGKQATHFLGDEIQIRFAYCKNHYPPSEIVNKVNSEVSVNKPVGVPKPNQQVFTIEEVNRFLVEQRKNCMQQRYLCRYKGVKIMEDAILNAPPPQEFIDKIIVKTK